MESMVCVDIYRPEASGKFPAILAFAVHNKDLQTLTLLRHSPSAGLVPLVAGGHGSRGHKVHSVQRLCTCDRQPERVGKSEDGGSPNGMPTTLSSVTAKQPWCDGNIGMIGIWLCRHAVAHALQQPPI